MSWDGELLVIGTGLIGTSIALAGRRAGATVWLQDVDPERVRIAADLGAGRPLPARDAAPRPPMDLVLVAVPPRSTSGVVVSEINRNFDEAVSHVCSVQAQPLQEIEARIGLSNRFLGSHPVAGREVSGPTHASADLLVDRPWVLCPTPATAPGSTATLRAFAEACGAQTVELDARRHDELLARLSHVPQLLASALAATLTELPGTQAGLAGSGLRDTTRLADSDPELWAQIVGANAGPVAAALRAAVAPLRALALALESVEAHREDHERAVRDLLDAGRAGRRLLPGKHGRKPSTWAFVHVAVPDEPGALARLFADVASEGVNVEDLRVEHAPGHLVGVAELAVAPGDRDRLVTGLAERGWASAAGGDASL